MTTTGSMTKKKVGYDKYVDYKRLGIAVGAFLLILLLPTPDSMRDVAVEYSAGEKYVLNFYTDKLFGKPFEECEQWEAMTARVLEVSMNQGTMGQKGALKKDASFITKAKIPFQEKYLPKYIDKVKSVPEAEFNAMMKAAFDLRHTGLTYDKLSEKEKAKADKAARNLKVVIAMVAFVVLCFLLEAMPLPGVAFCIGLILVFSRYCVPAGSGGTFLGRCRLVHHG